MCDTVPQLGLGEVGMDPKISGVQGTLLDPPSSFVSFKA